MGERGIGPKSPMERTNGCRELGRCSTMCSRFDASGSAMMRCDARCGEPMPLSGTPCFPFYRPRESTDYKWEKIRERGAEEIL